MVEGVPLKINYRDSQKGHVTMSNGQIKAESSTIEYVRIRPDGGLTPISKGFLKTAEGEIDGDIIFTILDIIESNKPNHKVLVIGDVMLDYYMYCDQTKLLESQKHNVDEDYSFSKGYDEKKKLGGAAHIAYACASFAQKVGLLGIIGEDSQGWELIQEVKKIRDEEKIPLEFFPYKVKSYLTITKMYMEAKIEGDKEYQHANPKKINKERKVIRINRELKEDAGRIKISPEIDKIENIIDNLIKEYDCVIFKDHQKGFLSSDLLDADVVMPIVSSINMKKKANEDRFTVFVDPKYQWEKFRALRIDAIIPNVKEAAAGANRLDLKNIPMSQREKVIDEREKAIAAREEASSLNPEDWKKLGENLPGTSCFVVTADRNGASLYRPGRDKYKLLNCPANIEEGQALSEIGCGDVFDAIFIAVMVNKQSIMKRLEFDELDVDFYALRLANYAAGLALCDGGSEIITPEKIRSALRDKSN